MKTSKFWSMVGLLLVALTSNLQAAELVVNGGFEQNGGAASQTFTAWQSYAQTGSQGGFYAQQGSKSAITPVTVTPPPEGSFAAMSDQPGPGSHALYQDIAIPAGQSATLTAKVYVQNAVPLAAAPPTLDYSGPAPNQQVRIDVVTTAAALNDVGAGVLVNVFQWPPAGSIGPVSSGTSYQTVQSDLSAYAGQTIRLRIAEVDNRQSLFFGVDAVSVQTSAVPVLGAPTGLTALVQGGGAALSFAPVASVPGQTVTGYTATCTPQGGGAALSGSAASSPVNVAALIAVVPYDCKVAATTATGTGPYSTTVSVTVPTASPGTTVIPLPQGGGNVAVSLAGTGGSATTTCTVQSANITPAQSAPVLPPQGAAAFPFGILSIKATTCAPGGSVLVNLTMPTAVPPGASYWKYGPTPTNNAPHWYQFSGFSVSGNVVTLTLTDGAEGDDDLIVDGNISDPGGIVVPVAAQTSTPIPVWNIWGLLAAVAAMLMAATLVLRRRQRGLA